MLTSRATMCSSRAARGYACSYPGMRETDARERAALGLLP